MHELSTAFCPLLVIIVLLIGFWIFKARKEDKQEKVNMILNLLYINKALRIDEIVRELAGVVDREAAQLIIEDLEASNCVARIYSKEETLDSYKVGRMTRATFSLTPHQRRFMGNHGELNE